MYKSCAHSSLYIMPHLHIRVSGEANSEENDERTNHIFTSSFVALAFEAVFRIRVKGDKWQFTLSVRTCVRTCECSYACENSSFVRRHRHTNVRANGEARHEHECVNAVS